MAKKRLVVIYHYGPGNEHITQSDYEESFVPIKNKVRGIPELEIEAFPSLDVGKLIDKLDQLKNDEGNEELYLHFSGHGASKGIPYGEWFLKNNDLAIIIDHPKIKFCFFSSCKSGDLVAITNTRNIPVVIGTVAENDIENSYAIAFQAELYEGLLASRDFDNAFEYALITTNNRKNKSYRYDPFVRGEGGVELTEQKLNALQIAFASNTDKNSRMLPSNFIIEMVNSQYNKPFCLNWFDDPVQGQNFSNGFRQGGFHQQIEYLTIPEHDLFRLNDRGDHDPIATGDTRLVIHCSMEEVLPPKIRAHLKTPKIWSMDNYKIMFCLKSGIKLEHILLDAILEDQIPKEQVFRYQEKVTDLFDDDEFIKALDQHTISFTERKKITLNFTSKPNKNEVVEIMDANKFVRVFFAKSANERLINFLVNWIMSKDGLPWPPLVVDNRINPEMNFNQELQQQILKQRNINKNLARQFEDIYDSGCIIVVRNRSGDIESSKKALGELIEKMDAASKLFDEPPETPTILFFLHENGGAIPLQENTHIYLKQFSDPLPVDKEMITEWRNKYDPLTVSSHTAAQVKSISSKIKPEKYKDCCPSSVIEFICDEFSIPHKQIIGI